METRLLEISMDEEGYEDESLEPEEDIEEKIAYFDRMNFEDLARKYKELRDKKDECKKELARITAEFDFVRLFYIPLRFEKDGDIRSMTTPEGRIGLTDDSHITIKGGKQMELIEWMKNNEGTDLIKDSINPSTLKAWVIAQLRSAKIFPPPEFVTITPFPRATVTKVNSKK